MTKVFCGALFVLCLEHPDFFPDPGLPRIGTVSGPGLFCWDIRIFSLGCQLWTIFANRLPPFDFAGLQTELETKELLIPPLLEPEYLHRTRASAAAGTFPKANPSASAKSAPRKLGRHVDDDDDDMMFA